MSTKDLKKDGKKPAPYTIPVEKNFGDLENGKKPVPMTIPKESKQSEKLAITRVFYSPEKLLFNFNLIKSALLNYSKHIGDVLSHDPRDIGNGVDVLLRIVWQAGTGHEVQVFEDGIEAFADAVMEFAQWGVAVDEQDGVVGGVRVLWTRQLVAAVELARLRSAAQQS